MGRSDVAIRRCWQEWMENSKFQRHDGSCRLRATADWEERLTVRSAVTASYSSLSTNQQTCDTYTRVHPQHSQTVDRAKFTLVMTTTPPTIYSCTMLSQITVMLSSIRLKSC
ncbi:hypothetical protein TNCV_516411 [Trichonephila clavipes]|nr:hypothetical protein TNCV_516411 [Trichonephila clavipes]